MGFYGNITNTSKTQFQFDRTYPNRATMEANLTTDGIYAGRYVLIEYDTDLSKTLDTFMRVYISDGIAYTASDLSYMSRLNKKDIGLGDIVFTSNDYVSGQPLVPTDCIFWKCTSVLDKNSNEPAIFARVVSSESNYVMNFNIDTAKYGESRGYDSTVWQKVYVNNMEKYVQIAELNSVVPTFDISADAPTIYPIQPHFDVNSTNVYYKLHWQPQWGFRAKEAKQGNNTISNDQNGNNYPSDEKIKYDICNYDVNTGTTNTSTLEYDAAIYYNKSGFDKSVRNRDISVEDRIQVLPTGISGASYNTHSLTEETSNNTQVDIQEFQILLPSLGNTISDVWDIVYGYGKKVLPDGTYDSDTSSSNNIRFKDIEWKDAVTGEENTGIGGMTRDLGTLAGCINKVHDLMGMIITDKNNATLNEEWFNKNYIYKEDNNYYRIHKYPIYTTFRVDSFNLPARNDYKSDQEYNTAHEEALLGQLEENKQYYLIIDSSKNNYQVKALNKNSLSSLKADDIIGYQSDNYGYEFVIIPDMPGKMATIYGLILKIKNLLEVEDSETRDTSTIMGSINAINDIIDMFEDLIPGEFLICDSNGKINSANWTTAQDYEYINYNSNNPISVSKDFDTRENRWLSLSVDKDNKQIKLEHVFNEIDDTNTTSDKNAGSGNGINNSNDDTLKLYTPIVDNMGHVVGKNIETVILPYGFKKITTNGEQATETNDITPAAGTSIADNTQDEFSINVGNKWLHASMDNTTDTLTLAHEVNTIESSNKTNTDLNDGTDTITIQDTQYDKAGHVIANQNHTYILPYGYKTFKTNGRDITENIKNSEDVGTTQTTANNTQDIMNINSGNYWIRADITEDNIKLSHSVRDIDEKANDSTNLNLKSNAINENNINIPDWTYDNAGHIRSKKDHYYTLPFGYKTITPAVQSIETINPIVNTTSIIADNTQDTLTVASANKWIRVSGNNINDVLSIGHEVHNFESGSANTKYGLETNVTVNDLNKDNTFEVPVLKFDEAGHITMAETHTVTIPENFDKVAITVTGKDSASFDTSGTATTLEADTLTDTVTFNVGNRWIQLVGDASTDKVSVYHAAPGNQTNSTKTGAETPNYGETFNIPEVKYDEAGHISDVSTHTVTFPTPSLNDLTATDSSVITGISMVDGTLAITQTNANIGTRTLTGYSEGTDNTDINDSDSINEAFGKLQKQIHDEETNRANDITNLNSSINNLNTELSKKISDEETARINAINALDVQDNAVDDEYVSAVSETDGKISVSRKSLPTYSLASGTNNGTVAFNGADVAVTGLGSAAYTNSSEYADANVLNNTTFIYGAENKTIAELFEIVAGLVTEVANLTTELTELKNKVETEHPTVNEPEGT